MAFATLVVKFGAVPGEDAFKAPADAGRTVKEAEFKVGVIM